MKCAKCGNEVGRAQIICDSCGMLLTDESSRVESPRPLKGEPQPPPPNEEMAIPDAAPDKTSPEVTPIMNQPSIQPDPPKPDEPSSFPEPPISPPEAPQAAPELSNPPDSDEPVSEEAEALPPLKTEAQQKKEKVLNIAIWGIAIFMPCLVIISWILCWKSNWQKKNKILFFIGSGLYALVSFILSLIPLILF